MTQGTVLRKIAWTAAPAAVAAALAGSADAAIWTAQDATPAGSSTAVTDILIRESAATTVQTNDLLVGRSGSGANRFRSLVSFDLTTLKTVTVPSGYELHIDSVSFSADQGGTVNGNGGGSSESINVSLLSYGDNAFSETTTTWSNAPTVAGGDITGAVLSSASFDPTPAGTYPNNHTTITFASTTNFVSEIVSTLGKPTPTFRGMLISPTAEAGSVSSFARFLTSEDSRTAYRPKLEVQYSFVQTPEPTAAAGIMVLGGLATLGRRRRFHAR